MSDIRVSALSGLTTDAICGSAIIAVHERPDRNVADPDMPDIWRVAVLADALRDVETAADVTARERALLVLAGLAGLWVDAINVWEED